MTSIAITMIGTWSVMPTAVMMLSIEKTGVENDDLADCGRKPISRGRRAGAGPFRIDVVMDLLGRLPHQKKTTGNQNHIAPRKAVTEDGNDWLGQLHDDED